MENNFLQGTAEIIVLLPHYNDNEGLKNAINSIVEPFPVDVLIIDDGSETKPDEQELKNTYGGRGNLEVKYAPENMGISKALNFGIKIIMQTNHKYIARMDSDDTNNPNRFAKQLTFLKENKDVSFLGSYGNYYDQNGKFLFTKKLAISDKEIRKKMYINNMFLHSAFFYKREVLEDIKKYPQKYVAGEDYHFCFLVIKKYKVANYPESLVNIVVRPQSISSKQRFKQVWTRIDVIIENFYFGFYPILGLFRNLILLFMPRTFGLKIRKWFNFGGTI